MLGYAHLNLQATTILVAEKDDGIAGKLGGLEHIKCSHEVTLADLPKGALYLPLREYTENNMRPGSWFDCYAFGELVMDGYK